MNIVLLCQGCQTGAHRLDASHIGHVQPGSAKAKSITIHHNMSHVTIEFDVCFMWICHSFVCGEKKAIWQGRLNILEKQNEERRVTHIVYLCQSRCWRIPSPNTGTLILYPSASNWSPAASGIPLAVHLWSVNWTKELCLL